MRFVFGLLLVALAGCPPAPVPTPQRHDMATRMPQCAADLAIPTACGGLFTAKGVPCATCPGAAGCFDAFDGIWCMAAPGCKPDATCGPQLEDGR